MLKSTDAVRQVLIQAYPLLAQWLKEHTDHEGMEKLAVYAQSLDKKTNALETRMHHVDSAFFTHYPESAAFKKLLATIKTINKNQDIFLNIEQVKFELTTNITHPAVQFVNSYSTLVELIENNEK